MDASIVTQGPYYKKIAGKIVYHPETPFDAWKQDLDDAFKVTFSAQRHIGQIWLQGEYLFGEMAYQAIEVSGYHIDTVKNCSYIVGKLENRWVDSLSFEHHKIVSRLDPGHQTEYLKLAEKEGLSSRELKERVNQNFGSRNKGKKTGRRPSVCKDDLSAIKYLEKGSDYLEKITEWTPENKTLWNPILRKLEALLKTHIHITYE